MGKTAHLKILDEIRKNLKKNTDLKYKENSFRFYKEEVKILGVRTKATREISRKYFKEIKELDKEEIFFLCEELLKSGYIEEATVAFDWAFRLRKQYKKSDFKVFERWLSRYISNWGDCDGFCCKALGDFIFQYPGFYPRLREWAVSNNRWKRRASAVVLIYSVRRKNILKEIFKTSEILLMDNDDLVQKGYGWTLKEASNIYHKQVFDFVMRHKKKMPRTALRYAIEKMPRQLKKKAMERE